MEILEQFVMGHAPDPALCEDEVVVTNDFAAVIDGATTKVRARIGGITSGKLAAVTLAEEIRRLPALASAIEAIAQLSSALAGRIAHEALAEAPSASVALYSSKRREVWLVGDCQVLIGDSLLTGGKEVDRISADARAEFLEARLLHGDSVEELQASDPGRQFLMPLLKLQPVFRNRPPSHRFSYGALDGQDVPDAFIQVFAAQSGPIVLATDGYPALRPSLNESELELVRLLAADPLLIRDFRSTKGLRPGNVSFDDRAYVRLNP